MKLAPAGYLARSCAANLSGSRITARCALSGLHLLSSGKWQYIKSVAVLEGVVDAVEMLIHIHRRLVALRLADDTRRYARRGGVRRNRLQYHRTGANLRATPDFNIAEDLRPGANRTPSRIFG